MQEEENQLFSFIGDDPNDINYVSDAKDQERNDFLTGGFGALQTAVEDEADII